MVIADPMMYVLYDTAQDKYAYYVWDDSNNIVDINFGKEILPIDCVYYSASKLEEIYSGNVKISGRIGSNFPWELIRKILRENKDILIVPVGYYSGYSNFDANFLGAFRIEEL